MPTQKGDVTEYVIEEFYDQLQECLSNLKDKSNVCVPEEIKDYQGDLFDGSRDEENQLIQSEEQRKSIIDNLFNAILTLHKSPNNQAAEESKSDGNDINIWEEGFGAESEFRKYMKGAAGDQADKVNSLFSYLIKYVSLINILDLEKKEKYLKMFPGGEDNQEVFVCLEGVEERLEAILNEIHAESLEGDKKKIFNSYSEVLNKYATQVRPSIAISYHPHVEAAMSYLHGFYDQQKNFTITCLNYISSQKAWEILVNFEDDLNNALEILRKSDKSDIEITLKNYTLKEAQTIAETIAKYGIDDLNDLMNNDDYAKPEWGYDKIDELLPKVDVTTGDLSMPKNFYDQDTPRRLANIIKGGSDFMKMRALLALDLMTREKGGSLMQLQQTMIELGADKNDLETGVGIIKSLVEETPINERSLGNVKSDIEGRNTLLEDASLNDLFYYGCNVQKLTTSIKEASKEQLDGIRSECFLSYLSHSNVGNVVNALLNHSELSEEKRNEYFQGIIDQAITDNNQELFISMISEFSKLENYSKEGFDRCFSLIKSLKQDDFLYILLESCLPHLSEKEKTDIVFDLLDIEYYRGNYDKSAALLIRSGVDLGYRNVWDETILHKATKVHSISVLQLLLSDGYKEKIDINAQDLSGNTALFNAVKSEKIAVVEFLLSHGASLPEKEKTDIVFDLLDREHYRENSDKLAALLIRDGVDLGYKDKKGRTILHKATKSHSISVFQLLFSEGYKEKIDINAQDNSGCTAIYHAVDVGFVEAIQILLDGGANITEDVLKGAVGANKMTALEFLLREEYKNKISINVKRLLSYAVDIGKIEAIESLLKHLGSLGTINVEGLLFVALANRKVKVVELLLSHGASLGTNNTLGQEIFHLAVTSGNISVLELLFREEHKDKININAKDFEDNTALYYAVESEKIEVVGFLLSHGASLGAGNTLGQEIFHLAVSSDNVYILELLFREEYKNKVDINAEDVAGKTALFNAVKNGKIEVVGFLLSHGGILGSGNKLEQRVFHLAAESDNVAVLQLLLSDEYKEKVEIDAEDKAGKTALYYACEFNNTDTIKLLMLHGASYARILHGAYNDTNIKILTFFFDVGDDIKIDADLKDENGKTALQKALDYENFEVARLLVERGGSDVNAAIDESGNTLLHDAVCSGNVEAVRFLLDHGADVNAKENSGITILSAALNSGKKEVLELLFSDKYKDNFDIDVRDKDGKNALYYAVEQGNIELVEFLLDHGASAQLKDAEGMTELHRAVVRGDVKIIELLLNEKYKDQIVINGKDYHGRSALYIAVENSRKDLVRILLDHGADINVADICGRTICFLAAESSNIEILELLFSEEYKERRGDINAFNNSLGALLSNLRKASSNRRVVKFLLDNGVDTSIEDEYGNSFVIKACLKDDVEILKMVLRKLPVINNGYVFASSSYHYKVFGSPEIVKILTAHGIDVSRACEGYFHIAGMKDKDVKSLPFLSKDFLYVVAKTHIALESAGAGNNREFHFDVIDGLITDREKEDGKMSSPLQDIVDSIRRPNVMLRLVDTVARGRASIANKREIKDELIPNAILEVINSDSMKEQYSQECISMKENLGFKLSAEEEEAKANVTKNVLVTKDRASSERGDEDVGQEFKTDDDVKERGSKAEDQREANQDFDEDTRVPNNLWTEESLNRRSSVENSI